MRKIEGNARHLLGLINDVLDLSKAESGKLDVYAEDFEVEPMLREVAATVGALVDRKANRVVLDIQSGLGTMRSDVKIRQMLLTCSATPPSSPNPAPPPSRRRAEAPSMAKRSSSGCRTPASAGLRVRSPGKGHAAGDRYATATSKLATTSQRRARAGARLHLRRSSVVCSRACKLARTGLVSMASLLMRQLPMGKIDGEMLHHVCTTRVWHGLSPGRGVSTFSGMGSTGTRDERR